MLNFCVPLNARLLTLSQCAHMSSGFNMKESEELLKNDTNQDKIKTEKFRGVLQYIKERNSGLITFKTASGQRITSNIPTDLNKVQELSELTNIFDTLPKLESSSLSKVDDHLDSVGTKNLSQEIPSDERSPNSLDSKTRPDQLQKMSTAITTENFASTYHADLSLALLPLSLHQLEDSLLVTAVVQDFNHFYLKTLDAMVSSWNFAQQQGRFWYGSINVMIRQPDTIQDKVRQHAFELRDKAEIWLCEKKMSTEADTKSPEKSSEKMDTSESAVAKIKKTIEGIMSSLKQKMEEQKKASPEKK